MKQLIENEAVTAYLCDYLSHSPPYFLANFSLLSFADNSILLISSNVNFYV